MISTSCCSMTGERTEPVKRTDIQFFRRLHGALLALLMLISPFVMAAATARQTVEALHAGLLDVMRNAETLGYEGRRARLAPLLEQSYDFPFITTALLGANWKGLDEQARRRAIDTVTRHTIATYASRFDGYSGERFETVAEESLARGRTHVRTRLVKRDGDSVQLDYVLHERDGSARIINVVADGVSDLSLKRAEYAAVIKNDGFDALMKRLEQQIADFASSGG